VNTPAATAQRQDGAAAAHSDTSCSAATVCAGVAQTAPAPRRRPNSCSVLAQLLMASWSKLLLPPLSKLLLPWTLLPPAPRAAAITGRGWSTELLLTLVLALRRIRVGATRLELLGRLLLLARCRWVAPAAGAAWLGLWGGAGPSRGHVWP